MTGNCCTMIVCSLSMIDAAWPNSSSNRTGSQRVDRGLEKRSQFDGAGEPIAAEFFEYNHWRIS